MQPPPPRAVTAGDYHRHFLIPANEKILQWVTPAALLLVFILQFFPWIGVYAGSVPLTTQGAWGAAFGIFQSQPIVFTLIAIAAVPTIWLFNRNMTPRTLFTRICLGALLGGALGNLTDRLRLGRVTDFIDVGVGDLRWPAFNIADSAFVVGIFALTVVVFLLEQGRRSNAEEPRGESRYA